MGFFGGVSARTKWHLAAAYEAGGSTKVRVQILRRSAVEEALSPPTGSKEMTGDLAARRITALLGHASLADDTKERDASSQLCPVLKDSLSFPAQGEKVIARVKAAMKA